MSLALQHAANKCVLSAATSASPLSAPARCGRRWSRSSRSRHWRPQSPTSKSSNPKEQHVSESHVSVDQHWRSQETFDISAQNSVMAPRRGEAAVTLSGDSVQVFSSVRHSGGASVHLDSNTTVWKMLRHYPKCYKRKKYRTIICFIHIQFSIKSELTYICLIVILCFFLVDAFDSSSILVTFPQSKGIDITH